MPDIEEVGVAKEPVLGSGPGHGRRGARLPASFGPIVQNSRSVLVRKDVSLMIDPMRATRPTDEPRLDVHNANVNEDLAEAGLCGTLNLITGGACQLPALHEGGCDFHRIVTPTRTGDEQEALPVDQN